MMFWICINNMKNMKNLNRTSKTWHVCIKMIFPCKQSISLYFHLLFLNVKSSQLLYTHTHSVKSSTGALMHRDRSQALRKIMVWILQPLISGQSALIKCVIKWRGECTLWIIYGKCWRSVSVMKTQHHSLTRKPGVIDQSNSRNSDVYNCQIASLDDIIMQVLH